MNFFQLTAEIKKRIQAFLQKTADVAILHFSKSKQEMEIQNTLFVVECTGGEILRREKIARAKFSIKNMSWNLPFTVNSRYLELSRDQQVCSRHRQFDLSSSNFV